MIRVWIVIVSLISCSAVIYHLNDTEHQLMPPLFSLDDYDSCLVEEGSTYCMLQLNLYAESDNELMRIITEYSDHSSKHYNYGVIDRGVCVKKLCQKYVSSSNITGGLTRSLEACLNDSLKREYGLNARISTLYYCNHHNKTRYIDAWDWTVLAIILGFIIINTVASFCDYYGSSERKEKLIDGIILSFSIMRNWKWLIDIDSVDYQTGDLQFIHGTKVIASIFVILAHAMMGVTGGFMINPHDIEKSYEHPLYRVAYNGLNIVQIFFFISGFLTAYKLKAIKKKFTYWEIPKIMFLRFSRLLPALTVTLAVTTSWVRHAGSGPLWRMYVTDSLVTDCRVNGWHHLFFMNNYLQKVNFCLIPTWHLAADTQVFLICVTAYILAGNRRLVLGSLLLLGIAAPSLHTALQDLDTVIFTPTFFRNWESPNFWLQHILGHNNIPCFIIGMASAVLFHKLQKKEVIEFKWYGLLSYIGLVSIPLSLYSGHVFFEGPRAPLLARTAYSSAIRPLIGFSCSLIFLGFFTKTPTYLKHILEWRYWIVPSRLSYCVFLVHMIFVHTTMGAQTQLGHFSFYKMMKVYLSISVASYLVSVPLCLMVEAPFTILFKKLFVISKQTNTIQNGNVSCINETRKDKQL